MIDHEERDHELAELAREAEAARNTKDLTRVSGHLYAAGMAANAAALHGAARRGEQ